MAVPVFMLLLPEGELWSLPLSPRPREGVWAAVWTPPLLPRAGEKEAAERAVQVRPPWGEPRGSSQKRLLWLTRTFLPFRNVECLNLLLSSGADLRRRDKFGRCVNVRECVCAEKAPDRRDR